MSSNATYAYYPGCSGLSTSLDYEQSTRAICSALGITLQDIPDWSCCGSTPAHTVDHVLSAALSARNLAIAESMGVDAVVTPCPSCLTNLKAAGHRMENETFKKEVNALLDQPCANTLTTKSVLQVLVEDFGVEEIQKAVSKPLKGLKVVPYYGCLMNRPPEVMDFDDPENPTAMDRILTALGLDVLDFPLKVECCGGSFGVARKDMVVHLSGKLLDMARKMGADAVVTACPLCQMNLDLRQSQINASLRETFDLPVFYYTQLLGLALGLTHDELLLKKLVVKPWKVLKKIEEPEAAAV
jgi:heterodisulfide reductase subunit B